MTDPSGWDAILTAKVQSDRGYMAETGVWQETEKRPDAVHRGNIPEFNRLSDRARPKETGRV